MENELISVIVPVYKTEKQLDRCLESLVCQTYSNLEIILVDDGSPDGCGRMCDAWAERDARIRVLHKKNEGLGMARNSGLNIARGACVSFVDSDDYVKKNHMEELYGALRRHGADLAVGGLIRKRADGRQKAEPAAEREALVCGGEIIEQVLFPILGAVPKAREDVEREMCVWRNLYRRDKIEELGLRFVSEREYVSEDIFFNMLYMLHAKKAVLIPACTYIYCDNPGSLTNSYRPDRMEKYCRMFERQTEILREYQLFERAEPRLLRSFIMRAKKCILLLSAGGLGFPDTVKECREILDNKTLQGALERYGVWDTGAGQSQRLVLRLMRQKAALPLVLLYKIKARRMKRRDGRNGDKV